MTPTQHSALVLPILQQVSLDRLKRATDGLADQTLTVAIAIQSESEIRALVTNSDGKEYGVVLSASATFCGCRDSIFRNGSHGPCKHSCAVALTVLRQPETQPDTQPEVEAPAVAVPVVVASSTEHLVWAAGETLCGSFPMNRIHRYPWNAVVLEQACQDCTRVYRSGWNAHMTHVLSHKAA